MNALEYKKKFQLSPRTALVSEEMRQELKERTLLWLKTISPERKRELKRQAIEARRGKTNPNLRWQESLENKNKKGTCPDQLLYKIHEVAKQLGHTPTMGEFIDVTGGQRYKHLILTTFGTWFNALKMANLRPPERKKDVHKRYSNEELLEYLTIYAQENKKLPTATDSKRGLLPSYEIYQRRFGTFERARQMAGVYQFIESHD